MNERLDKIERQRREARLEDREDARLESALAPLRELEPTAELRLKNRRQLAAALVTEERRRLSPRLSLWRRTVTLPLPLIVLLIALALVGGALLAWWLDLLPSPAPHPAAAQGATTGQLILPERGDKVPLEHPITG